MSERSLDSFASFGKHSQLTTLGLGLGFWFYFYRYGRVRSVVSMPETSKLHKASTHSPQHPVQVARKRREAAVGVGHLRDRVDVPAESIVVECGGGAETSLEIGQQAFHSRSADPRGGQRAVVPVLQAASLDMCARETRIEREAPSFRCPALPYNGAQFASVDMPQPVAVTPPCITPTFTTAAAAAAVATATTTAAVMLGGGLACRRCELFVDSRPLAAHERVAQLPVMFVEPVLLIPLVYRAHYVRLLIKPVLDLWGCSSFHINGTLVVWLARPPGHDAELASGGALQRMPPVRTPLLDNRRILRTEPPAMAVLVRSKRHAALRGLVRTRGAVGGTETRRWRWRWRWRWRCRPIRGATQGSHRTCARRHGAIEISIGIRRFRDEVPDLNRTHADQVWMRWRGGCWFGAGRGERVGFGSGAG